MARSSPDVVHSSSGLRLQDPSTERLERRYVLYARASPSARQPPTVLQTNAPLRSTHQPAEGGFQSKVHYIGQPQVRPFPAFLPFLNRIQTDGFPSRLVSRKISSSGTTL
jgi:hypothetical protein